ncbi:SGNH/GDSL hydrolase family protein [Paludibacterium sp. THUN1379]|nr:SGNH/GDSL hydrolase family protein [Paludibacterium sp. THUN1379]
MPFDKPTFTYLRCHYRQSNDPNHPESAYLWARDPASGDYFRLQGVWRAGGILPWRSMFYSDATQASLREVCRQTLRDQAGGREPVMVSAANNALSYNHTIWSLASIDPSAGLERLIAFGDSLSDTQNMYAMSQWRLPQNQTWFLGRFSNDRVWVERLAERLSLPHYNWAIGGAAGDRKVVLPGLRQQVASWQEYARADPAYRPERSLFTLWIGGNDLINYGRTPEQVIGDLDSALSQLIAQGARHLLVLNLPDLAQTPLARAGNQSQQLGRQVDTFNRLLAALLETLRQRHGSSLQLHLFDAHALFDDVIARPQQYQVENVRDNCLAIQPDSKLPYFGHYTPSPACRNADRYLFWDPLHPTAHTHQVLADRVAALLQAATRS